MHFSALYTNLVFLVHTSPDSWSSHISLQPVLLLPCPSRSAASCPSSAPPHDESSPSPPTRWSPVVESCCVSPYCVSLL